MLIVTRVYNTSHAGKRYRYMNISYVCCVLYMYVLTERFFVLNTCLIIKSCLFNILFVSVYKYIFIINSIKPFILM